MTLTTCRWALLFLGLAVPGCGPSVLLEKTALLNAYIEHRREEVLGSLGELEKSVEED